MFFKTRYFRSSRSSNKIFYLFNLFTNFNNFYLEFFGFLGFFKIFLYLFYTFKCNSFLKIFSYKNFLKNCYTYSILFNLVKGLFFEYKKSLLLFGLGYKVVLKFNRLYFYLSNSHPIIYNIPKDLNIQISLNEIIVKSSNKQRVGEVCLLFRNFKKPDIYKGKGVRYLNEKIVLKLIKKNK